LHPTSKIEIAADPETISDIMVAVDHWPDLNPAAKSATLDSEFIPGLELSGRISLCIIPFSLSILSISRQSKVAAAHPRSKLRGIQGAAAVSLKGVSMQISIWRWEMHMISKYDFDWGYKEPWERI
jgi:hypothetical protein